MSALTCLIPPKTVKILVHQASRHQGNPPPRRGLSVGLTSNRLTDNLSATLGSGGGKTSFCQSGWITARDEAAFNPGIKIWAIFTF